MTNSLTYNGNADGWTLAEYKSLLDTLAAWHDPATGRAVTTLNWMVDANVVFVQMERTDVADGSVSSARQDIEGTLSTAPNEWTTADENFDWGN